MEKQIINPAPPMKNNEEEKQISKLTFKILLEQAIFDYQEATENDERSDVIMKLIDNLENPETID